MGFLGFAEPPVADLDLILYAENGRRLRADVDPDGQPYVRYCASEESRVWLEMRSYRGTGRAAVMRFTGAPESLPDLGLRVGGCFAGEASERTPRLEVGPDPRFPMRARAPEALREGGRAPEGVLPEAYHALYATWEARGWAPRFVDWVALPQGGFVDVPVVLASADGACEAWGGAISSEARGAQVDLALRDERGRWVAWNLRSQSWATLYHCLEGRQRGVLRVRLRGGSGRVWLSRGE